MIFVPYTDESKRISELHKFNDKDYVIIRLTDTMIEKNNIDANTLFRDLMAQQNLIYYENLQQGGANGEKKEVELYSADVSFKTLMNFYIVRGKRGDRRFSLYGIKQLVTEGVLNSGDLLYITIVDNHVIVVNVTVQLPDEERLATIFGQNLLLNTTNKLIPMIKKIAKQGPHANSKGAGKVAPKDAGDTLEALLGIQTNNDPTADFEGEIELKTKTSNNLDTLFTRRSRFEGTPIANIEPDDKKRVSAYTVRYGYESDKHPNMKSLYVTINNEPNKQGLYLVVNENDSTVELWAKNPDTKVPEVSAFWTFADLKEKLQAKHPATIWLDVSIGVDENNVAQFTYNAATLSLSAQFSTFITLIKSGDVTYDWRGNAAKIDGLYTGRNHGNAWRIKPSARDQLFVSSEEINLQS